MKILNLLGKSVVSVAVFAVFGGAYAAQGGRASMMPNTTTARMPTIPTVGLTTVGNPAVTTVNQPAESQLPHIQPNPNPNPDPDPDPRPDPNPCPDGGVRNSDYTTETCMNDILQCINTGGLSGGLNDLFCDENVRNSVMTGMRLCQGQIDRCVREVRSECRNIYLSSNDVWLDFNSRIIQPEYYNFVLRKTGLTPNQAENTCLLLDRNTYGSSFAAVSDRNAVNNEYAQPVGAYNNAMNGTLSKDNPQGADVNTTGYSGNRGHYARWDACKAECLIRVAAYNKDELIKNSWLFGAVGNDAPAEVWEKAGSTFTCNKDLFDFSSLLNKTKTTAVVAVGGGTLLGAGIGAGVGAANYDKKQEAYNDPCSDEAYRKQLGAKIYSSNKGGVLKSYAYKNVHVSDGKFTGEPIFESGANFNELTEEQCRDLHELKEQVVLYESKINECLANQKNVKISEAIKQVIPSNESTLSRHISLTNGAGTMVISEGIQCGTPAGITQADVTVFDSQCKFKPLRETSSGVLCDNDNQCLSVSQIQYQVGELKQLLNALTPVLKTPAKTTKGKEVAKGALIGGATGAGVGGIVTGITALVEKNNITCRVGDGLNSVALGKSHTIDSLKDFYVKWNLNLPDAVSPTPTVADRASWAQACSQFNGRLNDCPNVQINLTQRNGRIRLVRNACVVSGSICIINEPVARSNGIR